MNIKTAICLTIGLALSLPTQNAFTDDTELYLTQIAGSGRPKVLIILDNSGSMSTIVSGTKPDYDPSTTYPTQGAVSASRIYWSNNGTPPSKGTDNYFLSASNRCASSTTSLTNTGTYTDYMAAWRGRRGDLAWRTVNDSNGTRDTDYVDCKADIDTANGQNPGTPAQVAGYPADSGGPYKASVAASDVRFNGSNVVTLFSANYMNWYHNSSLSDDKSRIAIAKEVVTDIVNANPNVDFGLMIFNQNNTTPHGGRLIQKINAQMSDAQRTNMLTLVDGLTPDTYTPLCETLYEAYRYYAGLGVYYGDDATNPTPARDTSAESGGNYISPMGDCQQGYVILMTDGAPTNDTHADSLVDGLSGIGATSGNRLDELAGWLYRTDLDNDASNGTQRVVTYTIGFQIDQPLLSDTAAKGGGKYYTAESSSQLQNAFQGALNAILQTSTTFTSPSVAVNSFNRSRSLDDIYMAMFKPSIGPRWLGNLKKLKIDSTGVLKDANDIAAIDPATGDIRDTARTLWSPTTDGNEVEKGGAGGLLASRDPATRTIKTDTGTNGALENFVTTNVNVTAALLGAADATERDLIIQWARGVDVDDENENDSIIDTRPWILGDPLHSKPLVINYGARGSYTELNPDIRILMGTNHGVLHMFGADDGHEDWAFMPKDLLTLLPTLRNNRSADTHPYGIDGSVVAYVHDDNRDGTISGVNDKVYIFFGLRRGGNAYYALNISDPGAPTFMWKIDASVAGFGELGQSWSTPNITRVPGHNNPVLVFGGGYDTNKDSVGIGTTDTEGRGIFIVDALNGALVWSATPEANSATNLQIAITDSIAAPVSILDSNADGLTDRIYAADTGGFIWRFDLPGNALPNSSQNTWSGFQFANLGGDLASDDRRFFNQPDIVRTRDGTTSFDAVLIGSGNRAHPKETDVGNRFYMLRDYNLYTAYFGSGGATVPAALTEANLYDATDNLVQDGTSAQKSTALSALAAANGWYIRLETAGEKSLATALTLNGTIFFTTFAPDASVNSCVPVPGSGYLYAVKLQNATAVYDWEVTDTPSVTAKVDRKTDVGNRLPDAVTPHFGEDTIRIIGVGAGNNGSGSYDTGSQLRTNGTYWLEKRG